MNEIFKNLVDALDPVFRRLMIMAPVKIQDLPDDVPKAGVYFFSEKERHCTLEGAIG